MALKDLVKKVVKTAGNAAANAAVNTVANTVTAKLQPATTTPSVPTVTTQVVSNPSNSRQVNWVPWAISGAVGLALIIALMNGGNSKRKR